MNKFTTAAQAAFVAVGVLATSVAQADDFWLYDAANKCISKDGAVVGVLPVAGAEGELKLATGSTSHSKTYPSDGVLDFSYPVKDGNDATWIITEMADQAYENEPNLKKMVLPSTLKKLGSGEFNNNAGTAPVITPKFPASLTYFADRACRTMRFESDSVSIGANGGDVTIGDSCFALGGSAYNEIGEITFGSGLVTMTQTDVFYSRRVKTIRIGGDLEVGSNTFRQMASYVTRIYVPTTATKFIATLDAASKVMWTDETDGNKQAYFTVHGVDADIPNYRVSLSNVPLWIILVTPTTDKGAVSIVGERNGETLCVGEVSPAYGKVTYEAKDLPIACSAPQMVADETVKYTCLGCRLDKFVEGAWQTVETQSGVTAYSFNPGDVATYRVVWLWQNAAYKCQVTLPEGYDGILSVESTGLDADGFATSGATVTLRAVTTDPAIPFVFWHGDVAAGDRDLAEISFVQTGARTLCPYFKTPWTWNENVNNGKITDGYWKLCVSGACDALTVEKSDPDMFATKLWAGGLLDLSKPVVGGGAIVALGNEALRYCTEITDIVLPESLTSIDDYALYTKSNRMGNSRLVSVSPCLPKKVVHLGQYALANYNGNAVKLAGELVWRPKTEATLGLEQQFGDQGFTKVVLGKNVRTITPYMFVRCASVQELYFEGDVPTFQNMNAFSGWSSNQATVYVPKGNASWQTWLDEHTLPACWKEVRFFTPDNGLLLLVK